jgi:hypothetical protein
MTPQEMKNRKVTLVDKQLLDARAAAATTGASDGEGTPTTTTTTTAADAGADAVELVNLTGDLGAELGNNENKAGQGGENTALQAHAVDPEAYAATAAAVTAGGGGGGGEGNATVSVEPNRLAELRSGINTRSATVRLQAEQANAENAENAENTEIANNDENVPPPPTSTPPQSPTSDATEWIAQPPMTAQELENSSDFLDPAANPPPQCAGLTVQPALSPLGTRTMPVTPTHANNAAMLSPPPISPHQKGLDLNDICLHECPICYEEYNVDQMAALDCTHKFCVGCFAQCINAKVQGGASVIWCPHMENNIPCNQVVDEAFQACLLSLSEVGQYKTNGSSAGATSNGASRHGKVDIRTADSLVEIATRHEQWLVYEAISNFSAEPRSVMKRSISQLCLQMEPVAEDARSFSRALLEIPELAGQIDYKVVAPEGNTARESWTTGWLRVSPALQLSIAPAFGMGSMLQAQGPTANSRVHYTFPLRAVTFGMPESGKDWAGGMIGTLKTDDGAPMPCAVAGKHQPAVLLQLRANGSQTHDAERWRAGILQRQHLAGMPGAPDVDIGPGNGADNGNGGNGASAAGTNGSSADGGSGLDALAAAAAAAVINAGGTTGSATAGEDGAIKHASALETLAGMGFIDQTYNIKLLEKNNGDVAATCNNLIGVTPVPPTPPPVPPRLPNQREEGVVHLLEATTSSDPMVVIKSDVGGQDLFCNADSLSFLTMADMKVGFRVSFTRGDAMMAANVMRAVGQLAIMPPPGAASAPPTYDAATQGTTPPAANNSAAPDPPQVLASRRGTQVTPLFDLNGFDLNVKWQSELAQLRDMGLPDDQGTHLSLIVKHVGNMERVINEVFNPPAANAAEVFDNPTPIGASGSGGSGTPSGRSGAHGFAPIIEDSETKFPTEAKLEVRRFGLDQKRLRERMPSSHANLLA